VEISNSPKLPNKICRLCHSQLLHTIAFGDNLSKVEENFGIAVEKVGKVKVYKLRFELYFDPQTIKMEPVVKREGLSTDAGSSMNRTRVS
jgi:hypothetical protein